MTCARVQTLLAAFADGGLEGKEHDDVAAHVRGCAACATEVRELRGLLAETRSLGEPEPRDEAFWQDLARGVRLAVGTTPAPVPFWRLPALGFALCLAAAALLFASVRGLNRGATTTETAARGAPSAPAPARAVSPLPAPSFAPGELTGDNLLAATDAAGTADLLSAGDLDDEVDDLPALARAAMQPDEAAKMDDGELALANPASAEQLVDSLDDSDVDLPRLAAAL